MRVAGRAYQWPGDAVAGVLHLDCYATRFTLRAVSGDSQSLLSHAVGFPSHERNGAGDALSCPARAAFAKPRGLRPQADMIVRPHQSS